MDVTSLPFLLAVASLVLGLLAAAIFLYVVVPRRRRAKAKTTPPRPTPKAAPQPPEPETPAPAARKEKVKQHSLFVIFAHPDATTDERLAEWLRGKEASYDAIKKVYLINGKQPSNPVTIANAFPPGEMPDLLQANPTNPFVGLACWLSRRYINAVTSKCTFM